MDRYQLPRDVTFIVDRKARKVVTLFEDGEEAHGTREPTAENREQAREQGYLGPDAVWHSLVDHEALHSLVAWRMWGLQSPVLRYVANIAPTPYARRLYEEALVISVQRYLNLAIVDNAWALYELLLYQVRRDLDDLRLLY